MESGDLALPAERGEVIAIWLKPRRGAPLQPVDQAELVAGRGLVGNAEQGGRRQITVLDERAWNDAVLETGASIDPVQRRANVLLRGIDLAGSRGQTLRIGRCAIRVWTEVTPCSKLDAVHERLRAALRPNWRGGICGEIVAGGTIRIGDHAEWIG